MTIQSISYMELRVPDCFFYHCSKIEQVLGHFNDAVRFYKYSLYLLLDGLLHDSITSYLVQAPLEQGGTLDNVKKV